MIKGLHHNAYRCRNSEETRVFYEDFLGMELAGALDFSDTHEGRKVKVLHTFYRLDDGSFLAFFEVPDVPFEFKDHMDFDLHIAVEVTPEDLHRMFEQAKAEGRDIRGISDHHFVDSIYFRDPSGYVIELTAKREGHDEALNPATNGARAILDRWTAEANSLV